MDSTTATHTEAPPNGVGFNVFAVAPSGGMSALDTIVGTCGGEYRRAPRIVCKDGFSVSIQASGGHYCTDANGVRDFYWDDKVTPALPFSTVEVGYPSERPEPWRCTAWRDGFDNHEDHPTCDGWEKYADDDGEYGSSVYGFVPVEMVRALIESHGGEA